MKSAIFLIFVASLFSCIEDCELNYSVTDDFELITSEDSIISYYSEDENAVLVMRKRKQQFDHDDLPTNGVDHSAFENFEEVFDTSFVSKSGIKLNYRILEGIINNFHVITFDEAKVFYQVSFLFENFEDVGDEYIYKFIDDLYFDC